jgi:molybdopterin/thiamine biosynthesis adenylyltransferase
MSTNNAKLLGEKLHQLKLPDLSSTKHQIFSLTNTADVEALNALIAREPMLQYHDEMITQCRELVKIDHPTKNWSKEAQLEAAQEFLEQRGGAAFGNIVYYPWSAKLIRVLPEEEFVRLRTSRNKHKITEQEQHLLSSKKVGIIGLSVGQSVALTMSIERVYGHLRIADFDTLELSNLNRIRKGLDYLGTAKTTMVVREIAEIDPYLKVELFPEGITPDNLDRFLGTGGDKLDLLVEECDSFPIKVKARFLAKARRIPVLMDTSDRGMLDVERFDLEPERPLLHGLVPEDVLQNLQGLNEMQRMSVLFKVVGGETLSGRLKASLLEMNQTLTSWPQLASSVNLGGAVTTDVVRRILLGRAVKSGRFYVDLESVVPETKETTYIPPRFLMPGEELREQSITEYLRHWKGEAYCALGREDIAFVVAEAGKAPSSGNDQPWEFVYRDKALFLFHRKDRSYSFGDFEDIASIQSIGAAVENLRIAAESRGYSIHDEYISDSSSLLKVVIGFKPKPKEPFSLELQAYLSAISERHTNRIVEPRQEIEPQLLEGLKAVGESVEGTKVYFEQDPEKLAELGRIVSACDKLRVLNPWGHYDFFHREMRWTEEQARERGDGIDIRSLEIAPEMMGAIRMLKDDEVINTLRAVDGGDGFNEISMESFKTASAVGIVIRPTFAGEEFYRGGMAWERLWLKATMEEVAVHPLIAPLYLFPRMVYGKGVGLSEEKLGELQRLRKDFLEFWSLKEGLGEVFMFKLFKTKHKPVRSFRLPLNEILKIDV